MVKVDLNFENLVVLDTHTISDEYQY